MKVHEHMSEAQLRKIIDERAYLSPERAKILHKTIDERLQDDSSSSFEEAYYTYHTEDAIFYAIGFGRPDPYYEFVFLNKRFIVYVYTGSYSVKLDFRQNVNKATEQDKAEVVCQLFDIIENADVCMLWDMTRENTLIEFAGA